MIKFITIIFFIASLSLYSQPQGANYQISGNTSAGVYANALNYEESVYLQPEKEGILESVFIYLSGNQSRSDTIRIVGDPSDGYLPSTFWVHGDFLDYNLYRAFVINYQGQAGWYELDMSDMNIKVGGHNRIGIAHIIKAGGPYFNVDNDGNANPLGNFLVDVFKPNPNFYQIAGTIISTTQNDFMAALKVNYVDEGQNYGNQLVDKTLEAGLVDGNGDYLKNPMGSVVDINSDGYDDLHIANRIFLNNGDKTFTDITDDLGLESGQKIFGDIDNDGYLDVFIVKGTNPDKIYWGSENGFVEGSPDILDKFDGEPTTTPLLYDHNNDGLLDIFIARGRTSSNGNETYYQDNLLLNLGNREFEDFTEPSGLLFYENVDGDDFDCWGASVTDYNMDGHSDIFVNTYRLAPDMLYKNNGDGSFEEVAEQTNAIGRPTLAQSRYGHGMGSDWADYDMDGDLDGIVGNLGHPDSRGAASNPSLLLLNDNNVFDLEAQREIGLRFYEMNAGPMFVDLNDDGYKDVWSCQYAYYSKGSDNLPDKNSRVYINSGPENNFKLVDMTSEFGSFIHGAWVPLKLDFDLDGDMDLVICSSNDHIKLFENNISDKGNAINIRVKSEPGSNFAGYGFNMSLNSTPSQTHIAQLNGTVSTGRVSQSTNALHFGIGDNTSAYQLTANFNNGENFSFNEELPFGITYEFNTSGEVTDLIKPGLIFPPNDDRLTNEEFYLRWKKVPNAVKYEVDLYNSQGDAVGFNSSLGSNDAMIDLFDFRDNTGEYCWEVTAISVNGSRITSDRWCFTIEEVTSVENMEIIGLNAEITPNVINNSSLNLRVEYEKDDIFEYSIIDQTGVQITDLGSRQVSGRLNQIFNINLASGKYYLVIANETGKKIIPFNVVK